MAKPQILVTNDDGIQAPGLTVLAEAMEALGDVWVYAPDRQQSAVGHGVSLHRPLRVTQWKDRWFMVDGTPTDCVMLAVRDLLDVRPDIVVAGVNPGANLGDDVTYSGTVAGAYEGMLLGINAVAFSDVSYEPMHLETSGVVAQRVAAMVIEHGLPKDTMLNVNVPDVTADKLCGTRVTRMGRRHYEDEIVRREDPRGRLYYWIGGNKPSHILEPGTDFEAIEQGFVSVTPLHRDVTNHAALEMLRGWIE